MLPYVYYEGDKQPELLTDANGPALTTRDIPLIVNWSPSRVSQPTPLAHHREFEIHLIKHGCGAYYIRDQQVPFQENTLLLIPPNVTHRIIPEPDTPVGKGTLMFWPARYGRTANTFCLADDTPSMLALNEHEATEIEVIFRALSYECEARELYWEEALTLQLKQLFLLIRRAAQMQGRRTSAQGNTQKRHALVAWCATEIEKRFAEDLPLQTLAREAGYSHFYLAHLFKRDTGLSVKQYILQRRIAEARRILVEQPALTVDAVALQVGFSSFALFNRVFKRLTGHPPTFYRKISHLYHND